MCDPYLNAFRGLLPNLGGIDFSPILAFTVLNVRGRSPAAALSWRRAALQPAPLAWLHAPLLQLVLSQ